MKILTWNLERIKYSIAEIKKEIENFDADILVLTETSAKLKFDERYKSISSQELYDGHDGVKYKVDEIRTTILTKFDVIRIIHTSDPYTSVCVELETNFGRLNVYGTIIGTFGGVGNRFNEDLQQQIHDVESLEGSICFAGDFNVFMSGYNYPSRIAREKLNTLFREKNLKCYTAEIDENVDHIALSDEFFNLGDVQIHTWNTDKKLSDHIGVCLELKKGSGNTG